MKLKDPLKYEEFRIKSDKLLDREYRAARKMNAAKSEKQREKYSTKMIKAFMDQGALVEKYFDSNDKQSAKNKNNDNYDDGL